MSSSGSSHYYALLPLLSAIGYASPDVLQAIGTALAIVLALIEANQRIR